MQAVTNNIFIINNLQQGDTRIVANVSINNNSHIFKGHFPGQSVVPGACMLQLVKDVLENALNASFLLKKATNLKFISMVDPNINKTASLDINYKITDDGNISVNAKLIAENITCFKFQGDFARI
jgi:3-hydroxyacyl-[acyl-carrier-protein] dehydratase